jgi:ABC-type transport system involved in cytochrome bd biosynthesis fused ATPase/permease subunit
MEAKPKVAQHVAIFGIVGCGKPAFLTLIKKTSGRWVFW